MKPLKWRLGRLCAAMAVAGLAACAGQAPGSGVGLRGVGTPDVSSYLGEGQATSVQALLERCRRGSAQAGQGSGTGGLETSCNQLRRTMRNQPGNTEQPASP